MRVTGGADHHIARRDGVVAGLALISAPKYSNLLDIDVIKEFR